MFNFTWALETSRDRIVLADYDVLTGDELAIGLDLPAIDL